MPTVGWPAKGISVVEVKMSMRTDWSDLSFSVCSCREDRLGEVKFPGDVLFLGSGESGSLGDFDDRQRVAAVSGRGENVQRQEGELGGHGQWSKAHNLATCFLGLSRVCSDSSMEQTAGDLGYKR